MVKALSDPRIWTEPKRRGDLINHVMAARQFRSRALVKLLAPHVDFDPYRRFRGDRLVLPFEEILHDYPVVDALARMGMIAVPDLLEVLKKSDPNDKAIEVEEPKPRGKGDGTGALKHKKAMTCLWYIYNRAGFGPEMLQKRIDLEIKNTPPKERGFLK